MNERIVAVAIKHPSGTVYQLPPPNRHHNVIAVMIKGRTGAVMESEQGFVTSTGRFVDRYAAKTIAVAANQQVPGHHNLPQLYSEDVW